MSTIWGGPCQDLSHAGAEGFGPAAGLALHVEPFAHFDPLRHRGERPFSLFTECESPVTLPPWGTWVDGVLYEQLRAHRTRARCSSPPPTPAAWMG